MSNWNNTENNTSVVDLKRYRLWAFSHIEVLPDSGLN